MSFLKKNIIVNAYFFRTVGSSAQTTIAPLHSTLINRSQEFLPQTRIVRKKTLN